MLIGQTICRASQAISDLGRACSEVLVGNDGPMTLTSFRQETKRLIPALPDNAAPREFLKGAFGRLKELLGRYCGESRATRAHTPPTCSIRHEKGGVLSVVRNGAIRDPLKAGVEALAIIEGA